MTVVTDGFDFMTLLTQIKYVIAAALCALLRAVYAIFRVIEGSLTVVYQGDEKSLASVFFSHRTVANLYFVMCLVGVVFALVIGVTSIIRKRLDVDEMKQLSVKQMLKSFFGSVLFMAALTFGMTLNTTLGSFSISAHKPKIPSHILSAGIFVNTGNFLHTRSDNWSRVNWGKDN